MFERLFIASISQRIALYLPNAICLDCASRGHHYLQSLYKVQAAYTICNSLQGKE